MESIKRELISLRHDAIVEIREMDSPHFNRFVLKFRPQVILTFPLSCKGYSRWYYIFKLLLDTKIFSFRAEGAVNFDFEYSVAWSVGYDSYGKTLVDYELFWGEKLGKIVGHHLVQQGKLSSMDRVKTVGYPRLEAYFENDPRSEPLLPSRIREKLSHYPKTKIVFCITGFHLADYSKQDLFDAKDLDAENRLDELLEAVNISKRFRSEWIANIIRSAEENPEALIIVKKHPIEKCEDYDVLREINNILYIYEYIQVQDLISYAGIFFHYGSTAVVDAYLAGVPSIYAYSEANKEWYADLGWPSTLKVPISEMGNTIKNFLSGSIHYRSTPEMRKTLKEIFDLEPGQPYHPAHKVAEILLDPTPPQKIYLSDLFFWISLLSIIWDQTFGRILYCLKNTFSRKLGNASK